MEWSGYLEEMLEVKINQFLESLKVQNYSLKSIRTYHSFLIRFNSFLSSKKINQITLQTIQDYSQFISHLSTSTQYSQLKTIEKFLRFQGHSSFQGFLFPKVLDPIPKQILSYQEIKSLLKTPNKRTPKGKRDSSILEIFYGSGLRIGEMTRLSVDDLDLKNRILRIQQGKGNRDRFVPLTRQSCHSLQSYLKVRLRLGKKNRVGKGLWLSIYPPHFPITSHQIESIVRKTSKKSGIQRNINPHLLRITSGTHLLELGMDLNDVREFLGHKTLSTTQTYLRPSLDDLKQSHLKSHPSQR